jgi:ribosomal protein S1
VFLLKNLRFFFRLGIIAITKSMITAAKKLNSPFGQLLKNEVDFLNLPKVGDLVEGEFIEMGAKKAFFDLKRSGTGIIFGVEFVNAQDIIKTLKVGEKILTKVIEPENDEGYTELSLTEADKQKSWQLIKDLHESGEIITAKMINANAGGLIAEVHGIKSFLPVSQLSEEHYPKVDEADRAKIAEELKKLVNQELNVKVIDFNSRTGKLIVSERELQSTNVREILDKYKVGDLVDGIVSGITDFGVFVKFADNTNLEGLVHISELDHRLIENPKELVKIDDILKLKIVEIKDGRVSLSLKALKENPWDKVSDKYKVGDEATGSVSRFNPFGAFVALDADIQGLIHVSQFGSVEEMKKQLELGKSYQFIIELVKSQEKRIILKLKK